jgi:protein SCO1/2
MLRAQDNAIDHHHGAAAPTFESARISGLTIPDLELTDQNGRKVRFYSDLIKGKVVAINTIFTTCTTICPLMGASFAKLSKILAGDRRGPVGLISISIDPAADTPRRLKQWSESMGFTGAGWTLLTGPKADIDTLLKALQVFTADKADHAPVVLIGGDEVAEWARASALLPPLRLAEMIQDRLDGRRP